MVDGRRIVKQFRVRRSVKHQILGVAEQKSGWFYSSATANADVLTQVQPHSFKIRVQDNRKFVDTAKQPLKCELLEYKTFVLFKTLAIPWRSNSSTHHTRPN
jgi:hypothetical protein